MGGDVVPTFELPMSRTWFDFYLDTCICACALGSPEESQPKQCRLRRRRKLECGGTQIKPPTCTSAVCCHDVDDAANNLMAGTDLVTGPGRPGLDAAPGSCRASRSIKAFDAHRTMSSAPDLLQLLDSSLPKLLRTPRNPVGKLESCSSWIIRN